MEPYNYIINTAQQPNFETGFAQGQAMKLKEQQQARQQQMLNAFGEVSKNPTVSGVTSLMMQYPEIAEKFNPMLNSLTEQQKTNAIRQVSDVFMALGNGKREMAMEILQEQADALRNAGDEQGARSAERRREMIESAETGKLGDDHVKATAAMFLAGAMGPEKFLEVYEGLLKMDSTVSEAQATAQKAATAAKFAESQAAMDLEKAGWDITKIQNDIQISKQNARIAAMNASIAKEGNDLKRQELALKVQDAITARDDKVRAKAAEVATVRGDVDNMLSTIQLALDTSGIAKWAAAGPIAGHVPGAVMGDEVSDYRETLKTLRSQTKLQQLKNLKATGATMGALNESEGEALEKSFVNLSTTQSSARLQANLKEAQRLLTKFRSNLTAKYGVPEAPIDLRPGTDAGQRTVTVEY